MVTALRRIWKSTCTMPLTALYMPRQGSRTWLPVDWIRVQFGAAEMTSVPVRTTFAGASGTQPGLPEGRRQR
jgi:hypothetical protein